MCVLLGINADKITPGLLNQQHLMHLDVPVTICVQHRRTSPSSWLLTDLVEEFTSWFIANARILIINELMSHIALISIWF